MSRIFFGWLLLSGAMAIANSAGRRERAGGDRYRDQDRPDNALYRSGRAVLGSQSGRADLHENDQRSGGHQWSQDQLNQCRRRLHAMANRERDAEADRSGASCLYFSVRSGPPPSSRSRNISTIEKFRSCSSTAALTVGATTRTRPTRLAACVPPTAWERVPMAR